MIKPMILPCPKTTFRTGDLSGLDVVEVSEQTGVAAGMHRTATLNDIVSAAIARHGPVRELALAVWSNTGVAPRMALPWLETNATGRLRFALRSGIANLQPEFCQAVQARWGMGALLVAESHVECMIAIGNGWSLAVTSSLGLWTFEHLEWYRVDRRPEVAAHWLAWFDGLRPFPPVVPKEERQLTLQEMIEGMS